MKIEIQDSKGESFGFRFILGRKWERAAGWVACALGTLFLVALFSASNMESALRAVYCFLIPLGVIGGMVSVDGLLEVLLCLDEYDCDYPDHEQD